MFLFVVSFGGKEQAVIFPVCLLLMDWFTGVEMNKLNTWFEKIPFFLIALLLGCVTLYVSSGKISLSDGEYVLWERLLFGCYSYVEYLLKWFVPVRLLYLYPFPSLPGEPVPDWLLWYPLLMVVVGWVFKRIFKFWPIYFGLLFFSINLLMTLHLIPMPRMAIVADRYIYISSIGLTFITGYYFMALYKKWKQYRFYLVIMFFVALFYLGTYANMRVRVWHDSNSLKQETQELIYSR